MKRIAAIASALSLVAIGWFAVSSVAKEDAHSHAHAALNEKAPAFELTDIHGKSHKLSDYKGKYVVLEWTNPDCPFVRKHYTGNMQKLQAMYGEKGVVWLSICSSAPGMQGYYTAADMTEKLAPNKVASTAYLLDPDGTVGHEYGAKTTPHMYVINPEGVLVYAGAIDDIPSTDKADLEKANNYVQECLDACLAGKSYESKSTTPYGCSVKYAKK